MSNTVDAVIQALKIALEEACQASDVVWKVDSSNRWINRLPGAWIGRWKDLKLEGDCIGNIDREQFIGHVRATLAYLESSRDDIGSMSRWAWRKTKPTRAPHSEPIDAEFKDLPNKNQSKLRALK